ncbi:hypothetical protein MCOR25_011196 [Pyricularia grisea]|nr:hypothetical protein MCOR25_011196 [Pyricularia grisea]
MQRQKARRRSGPNPAGCCPIQPFSGFEHHRPKELDIMLQNSKLYSDVVKRYSSRRLTFAGDILRALQEAINALSHLHRPWPTRFALPIPTFPLELGWGCRLNYGFVAECTPRDVDVAMRSRWQFPSWSWLAWRAQIFETVRQ